MLTTSAWPSKPLPQRSVAGGRLERLPIDTAGRGYQGTDCPICSPRRTDNSRSCIANISLCVYTTLSRKKRDTPKQEATVTSSSGCRVALQQWSVSEINSLGEDRYDGNSG
jgi:hypothetical protein